jgi:hypothetical protein
MFSDNGGPSEGQQLTEAWLQYRELYGKYMELAKAIDTKFTDHGEHEDILGELAVIVDMAWKYQELEH